MWSAMLVLWVGLELVQGGALRCVPGEDTACAAETLETVHPSRIGKALSGKVIGEDRGVYCLFGSKWDGPCGECLCTELGRSLCQREKKCTATDWELERQCAPDTMWHNDCNTCWCSDQGRAMCTRIGCPQVSEAVKVKQPEDKPPKELNTPVPEPVLKSSPDRSKKQVCVANRMFIKDCNTCWCNEDGTSFYCTRRVCVPDLPEPGVDQPEELRVIKKECRPNEVFELDCNMCRCNPDGKSYSCTRRACVDMDHHDQPSVEPVVQDAKVLTVQDAKVDRVGALDQTVDGRIHGSKLVPVAQDSKELPIVADQPVAGSVLQDKKELPVKQGDIPVDQPVLQAVVKDAENQPLVRKSRATEEMRKCEPGQEFRLDCNICLCDNLGQDFSCTRHDCNAPNGGEPSRTKRETSESAVETVTMQCVAGSVFDRDCNVCRCTNDGESALCTNKSCTPRAQPLSIDAVTNAPDSDPNFRCNPGEQLKRGCNDCQCSADGRSVFCTVRFCDQDITPPPSSV